MRACNVIVCLFIKLCPKHDNTYLTRIHILYLYAIKKLKDDKSPQWCKVVESSWNASRIEKQNNIQLLFTI